MKQELKKYLIRIKEQMPGAIVHINELPNAISFHLFYTDIQGYQIIKDSLIFNYDPKADKKTIHIIRDLRKLLKNKSC